MDNELARLLAAANAAPLTPHPAPRITIVFEYESAPRVLYDYHDPADRERLFDWVATHDRWAELIERAHDLADETR